MLYLVDSLWKGGEFKLVYFEVGRDEVQFGMGVMLNIEYILKGVKD